MLRNQPLRVKPIVRGVRRRPACHLAAKRGWLGRRAGGGVTTRVPMANTRPGKAKLGGRGPYCCCIDADIDDKSTVSRIRVAYLSISPILLGLYGSKYPRENGHGASKARSSHEQTVVARCRKRPLEARNSTTAMHAINTRNNKKIE